MEQNSKYTLLVVEDEASVRSVLDEKFTREGFGVLVAKNGEDGLAIALEKHPDIILLDIVMHKMDGITMLKKLRDDEWGKSAKVIILTNLDGDDKIEESTKNGVFDYLIKTNWKIEDVVKKVKERLKIE